LKNDIFRQIQEQRWALAGFSPTLFLDLPKFIIFQCFSLKS